MQFSGPSGTDLGSASTQETDCRGGPGEKREKPPRCAEGGHPAGLPARTALPSEGRSVGTPGPPARADPPGPDPRLRLGPGGFGSALAYYDMVQRDRLPAALVQGLRDFFGAHTYQRLDREGVFHTLWSEDRTERKV